MTRVIGALRVTLGLDSSSLTAGLASAQKSLSGFGRTMRDIGGDLSLRVTAPLAAIGGGVLAVAGNFEAAMNRVEAATGASGDEMAALTTLARDLGKDTVFSAGEAAGAVEMLAKNGLDASQILGGALKASMDLAAAGGADLASAADLTTDILANFKKDVGDLGPVVDGVAGVLIASKFGFEDYRLALAQAGGVAGGLNVTLEDFNAVIAATSPAFASGSDAGTSFKTFLQRLVPASKGAAKAMAQLGLEFFTAEGAMKSMPEIAQELQDGFSGLSDLAKTDALSTIFGTDAMRTAIGLMDQGAGGIERLDAAIREASAADLAAARTKGFFGALEQLKGAVEELGIAIASSGFLDWATRAVTSLTDLVDRISETNPELLRLGTVVALAAAAVGPLLVGFGLAATAIGAISAPIAAVVLGAAALGAAAVGLYTNWDSIREQFPAIAGVVENVGAAIGELASGGLERFRLMLQGLEQLFSGDLKGAVDTAGQILTSLGETVAFALGNLFGKTDTEVRAAIDGMNAAIEGFVTDVGQWFTDVGASISAFVTDARARFDEMTAYIQNLRATFLQIGRDIIDGLLSGLREKWESVKAWFTGLAESIPEWVREKLGIQSPSTVFAEIGRHLMDGLRQGLGSETGTIKGEMEGFANQLSDIFAGVLFHGQSLKEGLRGLASQTLGKWAGGMLDKGLGALTGALFPGFANGTNFAPGGLAWVGERGRELVNLPRGSQVIPHRESMAMTQGGGTVNLTVDVRGATGNEEVQRMVAAGVASGMAQVRREVPGIVTNARRRGAA